MAVVTGSERVTRTAAPPAARDRVFYSSMAFAMAAVVFVGFAPTYYLRTAFGAPATISGTTTLSTLAQVHGALFTGWVLLFVVQTALVASHRVRMHRQLGMGGATLAAAMIVVGTWTAIAAAARGSAPPGVDPKAFLIIPLGDMVLFAGFAGAAIWKRRRSETHKRLMVLAYTTILAAAVARWPGVEPLGPLAYFGLAFVFVVIAAVYDVVSRGRVHPAYVWGGALLVASVPFRLMASGTTAWRSVAEFLIG